jgi:uncharacterized protein (DUF1697 family)
MTTWVALLRAVNLGPTNKVAMAELRTALAADGYNDVRTHLQSGNVLFSASGRTTGAAVEKKVAATIRSEFGLDVKVMVRSASELDKVVHGNPFVGRKVDPKQLHAVFLSAEPAAKQRSAVDPDAYAPDELVFGDRVVYVRLPNGVQGAKLPSWEKLLGVDATMRTWRTVTRLAELAANP